MKQENRPARAGIPALQSREEVDTSDNTTTEVAAPHHAPTATIKSALLRYRILAWVTGSWLLLLTAEVIAKYSFHVATPSWIAVAHGWVYFGYLLVTTDLAVKVRWSILRTIGTLLAGTVPLLSFVVEHLNAEQVMQTHGIRPLAFDRQ